MLVDWRAAFIAGIVAGALFAFLNLLILPDLVGGEPWTIIRIYAAIGMGDHVLAPPPEPNFWIATVALTIHMIASMIFTMIIAYVIHRGGFAIGVIGGAALGLAIYGINFYGLSGFFPHFYPLHGTAALLLHVFFGAVAGGTYEALEREPTWRMGEQHG